ncbi:MAG: polysaccharide pyruvyl transferase family protein [Verrucomicrobia bacterium]|nr:polysaccharide pyruvyl transferase family protein [Verrucomicrobiota bacterium]
MVTKKSALSQLVLLTPYLGYNLGDGAIQESVITNIKIRAPQAKVLLSVLQPALVSELHGVPAVHLTGLQIRYYSAPVTGEQKSLVNKITGGLVWPLRFLKMLVREIRHVLKTFFLLRGTNLLIISGGGQIDDYWGGPWGHPYSLFKWALLARVAGAKLVFLGIGVCALKSKISRVFIRKALSLASSRSYRDQGSKDLLRDLSFTRSDSVIPDLAFGYLPDPGKDCGFSPTQSGLRIGLNPIPYLYEHHWPKSASESFDRYFQALHAFTASVLRNGHKIVLFGTDISDDNVVNLLLEKLKAGAPPNAGELISIHAHSAPELLTQLEMLDCVVVSRLHAAILSHLCVKPVLAISYDRKVSQYMQDMEQQRYCLSIDNLEIGAIEDKFDLLISEMAEIRSTVRVITSRCRGILSLYFDEMLENFQ